MPRSDSDNAFKRALHRLLFKGPKPIWLRYLLLIAAASGLTRFALGTPWMRESAVLYVLIPYLVGVLIYVTMPHIQETGYFSRLWRHMRVALIIMLSTSLLLFEGFLCVVMFLPIYLVFAMVAALAGGASKASENGRPLQASLVPLLILFLSLDGIRGTPLTIGADRSVTVERSAVLNLCPDEIQENILNHDYPDAERSKFLALFPRPVSVEATSVDVGATHIAQMEYRRWGVPGVNVHRGTIVMEFTESEPLRLRARFTHDDSYLSHYMRFDRWALDLTPLPSGQTRATIRVDYERKLAPSWYFGPLQKRAVSDGLDYTLAQILARAS